MQEFILGEITVPSLNLIFPFTLSISHLLSLLFLQSLFPMLAGSVGKNNKVDLLADASHHVSDCLEVLLQTAWWRSYLGTSALHGTFSRSGCSGCICSTEAKQAVYVYHLLHGGYLLIHLTFRFHNKTYIYIFDCPIQPCRLIQCHYPPEMLDMFAILSANTS